jgi:hypothetical protein
MAVAEEHPLGRERLLGHELVIAIFLNVQVPLFAESDVYRSATRAMDYCIHDVVSFPDSKSREA